ncbi:hypothetical protein JTB14_027264 [Gonioctena quinquepunctata]|nr:hypothetical protein JTB14_027264 [Gonioctena quinquepunctata]
MVTLHVTRSKPNTNMETRGLFFKRTQLRRRFKKRMETRGLAKWSISLFFCPEENATHSTDGSSPTRIYPNKRQDTTQLEDNYNSSPNACLQRAVTNTLFLNIRSLSNKMDE